MPFALESFVTSINISVYKHVHKHFGDLHVLNDISLTGKKRGGKPCACRNRWAWPTRRARRPLSFPAGRYRQGIGHAPQSHAFDEPTSALNPEMIGEVLNVMA